MSSSSSSSVRLSSHTPPPPSSSYSLLTQPTRHSSPEPSSPSRSTPTNDDIEAVIKMATSSHPPLDRPLRDTRTQLFVGNLPYRVRWQDLKDLFRRAGTVLRADVSLGPDNRSRGYGTVLLATAEDAGRAIDMFNGYNWQTRVLEVRPDRLGATVDPEFNVNSPFHNHSVPLQGLNHPVMSALNSFDELTVPLAGNSELLSGGTGMRTLFVGNLPFHIQWQDLKDLCRAAGAVARADVALGPDGRSRGFGTVTFVTEDGAERARRMFDGYEFNGRPLKVHYDKFAQSSQNNQLGVSPQLAPASILSHDSIAQFTSPLSRLEVVNAHNGRPYPHFDSLGQSQLHLDVQRSRLEVDGLSPAQLDAILARPRSTSFKSPSLTPPTVLSQPPSHLQSPAFLQSQGQSLSGSSLAASIPQPVLPSAASLSQPHSLTGSPLSISAKLSSSGSSSRNLGSATDLTLVTDLNDIRLTPDSFTSIGTSFGSPRPSLSAGSSQPSSFSSSCSRKPNVGAPSRGDALGDGIGLGLSLQRTSFSSPARPSLGVANAEKSSSGVAAAERPTFGLPFGSGNPQRLSMSLAASQNPGLGASSQKSVAPSVSFSEDGMPSLSTSALGDSKISSLPSAAIPFSLPSSKGGLHPRAGSPPKSISSPYSRSDRSRIGSPESRASQASPSHGNSRPLRSSSGETLPEVPLLTKSILNTDASDTTWGGPKPHLRDESPVGKANGTVDYVTTALGALGMRRVNRAQSKQVEEKKKSSSPSGEQQSQTSSTDGQSKKSAQSSSHRHPGPISLPPPTTFNLPPGVVFSPHTHPQSPVYHPGYPLSPVHAHPMGSPLHHPLGSPLHHPAMHSPLHHPGHPQYGAYPHHHAVPVHYGVITPHGLPPITPSMPPFTFLPPQAQTSTQSGHTREDGSEEKSQHPSQSEVSHNNPPGWESAAAVPQVPYYPPPSSNPPQQRMQYTQVHPHMFSPGVPLSPGIMVPLSPSVSMPIAGVPVSMTPGVALTPGVTMTPGALWPHAPWMNPAVGAPVHAANGVEEGPHGVEGYFPPVTQPSGNTGYFPPVPDIASDILKEGHGLASGPSVLHGDSAREGHAREGGAFGNSPGSSPPGVSRVTSPDPSQKVPQDGHRKASPPQVMKRSTSAQCEGGLPKRNGLFHRESDPEVNTATNKGSKEA